MSRTEKIRLSFLVVGIYLAVMYFTTGVAFHQHQIRMETALYSLAFIYPFLVIPLSIANALSNLLFSGSGTINIIGGFAVGLLTSGTVAMIKILGLDEYYTILPIMLVPAFIMPVWLAPILGMPYSLLVVSLLIGQFVPAIVGFYIVKHIINH